MNINDKAVEVAAANRHSAIILNMVKSHIINDTTKNSSEKNIMQIINAIKKSNTILIYPLLLILLRYNSLPWI